MRGNKTASIFFDVFSSLLTHLPLQCCLRFNQHLKYIILCRCHHVGCWCQILLIILRWMNVVQHLCRTRLTQVYEARFCISVLVHKGSINASRGCVHVITYTVPTCSQEAMGSKQQLWRDLHFGFALVFKSRKISLVLVGCHLFPGPIIRWNGTDKFMKVVLSWAVLKRMKRQTN